MHEIEIKRFQGHKNVLSLQNNNNTDMKLVICQIKITKVISVVSLLSHRVPAFYRNHFVASLRVML